MLKDIFKDKYLNNQLNNLGFVKFKLAEEKEIDSVRFFFENENPKLDSSCFTTFLSRNAVYKKKVNEFLLSFIEKKCESIINDNFYPFFSNFMIKFPNQNKFQIHSDWSYSNEPDDLVYNIWYPLEKRLTNKNGRLWVVPYSHKYMNSLRGINLPRVQYDGEEDIQKNYAIPLSVKKGEAVIWDSRLLHFSYPNFSNKIRLAVSNFMACKSSKLFYYFFDYNKNLLNKYEIPDREFLYNIQFDAFPNQEFLVDRINKESIGTFDKDGFLKNVKKSNIFQRIQSSKLYKKALVY